MKDWKLLPAFVLGVIVGGLVAVVAFSRYDIQTQRRDVIIKLDKLTGKTWRYQVPEWTEIKTDQIEKFLNAPVPTDQHQVTLDDAVSLIEHYADQHETTYEDAVRIIGSLKPPAVVSTNRPTSEQILKFLNSPLETDGKRQP